MISFVVVCHSQKAAKESLNKFVNANDIVTGNARLNFAFVATLFVRQMRFYDH
jgi:hypothetical protein